MSAHLQLGSHSAQWQVTTALVLHFTTVSQHELIHSCHSSEHIDCLLTLVSLLRLALCPPCFQQLKVQLPMATRCVALPISSVHLILVALCKCERGSVQGLSCRCQRS